MARAGAVPPVKMCVVARLAAIAAAEITASVATTIVNEDWDAVALQARPFSRKFFDSK